MLGGVGWYFAEAADEAPRPLGSALPVGKDGVPSLPETQAAPFGPYGALARPDANGLRLPPGFAGRIVARSGERVADSNYRWHPAPDGGACFADGEGWVYVSNSEMDDAEGGVGVLRFGADGTLLGGYPILTGTERNCAGGATPWGTWLSCEETSRGVVFETFPLGGRDPIRHDAMGVFRHEAAAVDPDRRRVYLTEDQPDGCFYRFTPLLWPNLAAGRLEVLCGTGSGPVRWEIVPDPGAVASKTRRQVSAAMQFDGGEGCVYGDGSVWFTTKGDGKVWRLDAAGDLLSIVYDEERADSAPVSGLDNLARSAAGELFIAEDRGSLDLGLISPNGTVSVFAHLVGHRGSEITGPAFNPAGTRMYFSSQRGQKKEHTDGYTFEISGPFNQLPRGLLNLP